MGRYSQPFLRNLKSGRWQAVAKYKDSAGKHRQITKVLSSKLKRGAKLEMRKWYEELERQAELYPDASAQAHRSGVVTVEDAVRKYLDYQHARGELEDSTCSAQVTNCNAFPLHRGLRVRRDRESSVGQVADRSCCREEPETKYHSYYILYIE